ncbi:MAG: glycosyltransferase [Xanthomonadales bacterium]|nr:glycosyltransferase [Xanthomonadales bacterium]
MKVLYICGTYAPGAFAGSELSAHELMVMLNNESSASALVVTDEKYTGGMPGKIELDGVPVLGVSHDRRKQAIREIIETFGPDVILTQLMWSDVAVQCGKQLNIPTVLRIPSMAGNLDIESPTALVANSRFVCDWAHKKSGRTCHFITSVINLERVVAPKSLRRPRYITMFNPLRNKGGHIFREISKAMPATEFAFVPGWHSLKNADGTWNKKVIDAGLESQGATHFGWTPEEVDLSGLDNVKELEPRDSVADIFAETRILLVPSQYKETLARVSIEAMANGIPVLGSEVGGLQDHVRKAGVLVKDYANPLAWVREIERLDDPNIYAHFCEKGLKYIREEFSNEETFNKFMSLFEDLVRTHNVSD